MSIGFTYSMRPATSARSVRQEITLRRGKCKEVYKCFARNESRLFDELNAGPGGRAGWNLYRREVMMPEREWRREEEEGRRDSNRCIITNPRMNSVCEHVCAIC